MGEGGETKPQNGNLAEIKNDGSLKLSRKTWMWIVGVLLGTSFFGAGGIQTLTGVGRNIGVLNGVPVDVQVSSPQMQQMIEDNLTPVQEMIADHSEEFAHPKARVALDAIEHSQERQEKTTDQIRENLAETTAIMNRMAGQVETLVDLMRLTQ